jgi:hypothetical protein
MNIVDRGKAFVQLLQDLAHRSVWEWRRCPRCGSMWTCKWGSYVRRPWFFEGRRSVVVPRHKCHECRRTYSETSAWLVRGSWYGREVHRWGVDHWQHVGSSLRRTAEEMRSWLGKQERYWMWRPWAEERMEGEHCYLAASTIHRWLDGAGREAERSIPGQLEGIGAGEELGTDGLWARLRRGAERVVLLVVDNASGLIWPPVVARGEKTEGPWRRLFERAQQAGLDLERVRGVTSDGVSGLAGHLKRALYWVNHQRCVWHVWRNLGGELARMVSKATAGLEGAAKREARQRVREELGTLIHGVLDAASYEQAEVALATLLGHPLGARLGQMLNEQMDKLFMHLTAYCAGLGRVGPEWVWRDFRLRLSRGRNHGSNQRLERAALVWAIYRNFTPAQCRSERKRHYRYPGHSPLEVAGASPGKISYLDALGV